MRRTRTWTMLFVIGLGSLVLPPLLDGAQGPPARQGDKKEDPEKGPPFGFKKGKGFGGFFGPKNEVRKLVKQFDKDGDGRLNKEERQAARELLKKQGFGKGPGGFGKGFGKGGFGPGSFLAKPLLEAFDADKDGRLTKAELVGGLKKVFAAADKDGNGSVDELQLAEALNPLLPPPPFGKGPPGGKGFKGAPGDKGGKGFKGGKGGLGMFGPGTFLARGLMQRADKNKDGKLTLAELEAAAEAIFKEADRNKDGKLDEEEFGTAVALLFPPPAFGPGGFGPGGFGKGKRDPARPGPRVSPAEVKTYPKAGLYEPTVLRTLFLEFEGKDWEAELADFYKTDVLVPATLTVDGKKYPNVGVHFRGQSSYFMVQPGHRRSLNLSLDFVDRKQRLYGYKTLNLLNSADDPSFLHTVLCSHVARQYIPAPKANLVKVVINGESWGLYVNAQQFNKDFLAENYRTKKGARWKVSGNPGARGGLEHLGDNVEEHKRIFTIKSKDNPRDWKALIELCRTLNKTPLDRLEKALEPMLDLDEVLWFLALDNAVINDDGYWVRASDYSLYRDPKGKFHLIPHDMNETFAPLRGFGFGFGPGFGKGPKGGPGAGGPTGYALDPLVGLDNPRMPLRSRLLAVPSLREKYLKNVRTIAEKSLDWKKLGPVVRQYRALIEKEVEIDTRKLYTLAEFQSAVADKAPAAPGGREGHYNLRAFAEGRRAYLLNHPAIRQLGRQPGEAPAREAKPGGGE
jgi:Ca2+-binding EF-hand superfamily protein